MNKVIIEIPNKYQEMLLENEENNDELNEDLKNYFIYLIHNIKLKDIDELLTLLSRNNAIIGEFLNTEINKLKTFKESLKNYYNLVGKNSGKNNRKDSNECSIYLEKKSDIHASPCEHMLCYDCIQKLNDRKCPKCKNIIRGIIEHP